MSTHRTVPPAKRTSPPRKPEPSLEQATARAAFLGAAREGGALFIRWVVEQIEHIK